MRGCAGKHPVMDETLSRDVEENKPQNIVKE